MFNLDTVPFSGASDNYTRGRAGQPVKVLVVHVMAGSERGTRAWFNNPASNVSAHYGISNAGDIEQFVELGDTAWHSGKWDWNLKTVGIEHEGRPPGWSPTAAQYAASVALAVALCVRFGIVPSAATIIPHVQINPLHACPSSGFPLAKYIRDVQDGVAAATRKPVTVPTETAHVEMLEYNLYDPLDNVKIGTITVVKGTDKSYLKTLTRKLLVRPGRPTAESFGAGRLYSPESNLPIGTVSLVLSGPRKAYLNALSSPASPTGT